MPDRSAIWNFLLGRLSLQSLPLHNAIVVYTFVVVAILGAALLGVITWKRQWGYLWREWFTSVDHKKLGIMYMILATVMLLRGFADAIMMRTQQAIAFGSNLGYLPPHHYDQIFTAHGAIMIFFVAMAYIVGPDELRHADADRRPRRGVPVPEQLQFLDDRGRRAAVHGLAVHRRLFACRLAGLSAGVGAAAESRTRRGLLHLGPADVGSGHAADRHQLRRHHHQDARARA